MEKQIEWWSCQFSQNDVKGNIPIFTLSSRPINSSKKDIKQYTFMCVIIKNIDVYCCFGY